MKEQPDFHSSVRAVAQELVKEIIDKINDGYIKANLTIAFDKVLKEQEERSL